MLTAIAIREVKNIVEMSGAALDRGLNMGRGKPNMFLLQNYAQDLGMNVRTLLNGFGVSLLTPDKGGKDDDVMSVILKAMGKESPAADSSDEYVTKADISSLINTEIQAAFKEYMPQAD